MTDECVDCHEVLGCECTRDYFDDDDSIACYPDDGPEPELAVEARVTRMWR